MVTQEKALQYFKAGLTVFPTNDKKEPLCKWKDYATAQSEQDVLTLFRSKPYGMGLICGIDGLEVIDIDTKNDPHRFAEDKSLRFENKFFAELAELCPTVKEKVVIQRTQSGGWHLIYKCQNPQGNRKLARLLGVKEAVLETRGTGGYIVLSPTPYYSIQKGDILNIQILTNEERSALMAVCCSFDQQVKPRFDNEIKRNLQTTDKVSSWQEYNNKADIVRLLVDNGWSVLKESASNYYLTRPNKQGGISANVRKSDGVFYCFTSSTQFEPNAAYSPFAVYAFLAHSGDFSEAARVLYQQGYGERIEATKNAKKDEKPHQGKTPIKIDALDKVKFDYNQPIQEKNTILNICVSGDWYKIAGLGNLVVIAGGQKSRKSTVGNAIIASALSETNQINFALSSLGKNILAFDTEQPFERFQKSQHRLFRMAEKTGNQQNYASYALRGFSKNERLQLIEQKIYSTDNLGIVLLDGIVDLVEDYNDLKESSAIVERLMKWTDEKQILLIVVLHLTKTTSQLRGHLGTELQNKADAVIETAKATLEGWTDICCRESREIPFPSFQFTQNSLGLPVLDLKDDVIYENACKYSNNRANNLSGIDEAECPF